MGTAGWRLGIWELLVPGSYGQDAKTPATLAPVLSRESVVTPRFRSQMQTRSHL
jgi:hypothetical protein